jgi:hypothetical protein
MLVWLGLRKPDPPKVFCDVCDREYTHSEAVGGFLLKLKHVADDPWAYCPLCDDRYQRLLARESPYVIVQHCPSDEAFADFVRRHREAQE